MLNKLGSWAIGTAERARPWTNVYGTARTLLALSAALTLIFNRAATLFPPGAGLSQGPVCTGARGAGAFCLLHTSPDAVRWLLVLALMVIASGWRPALTALPHWWIAWSLQSNVVVVDGGDQLSAILTLLILPIAWTDRRKWHWASHDQDVVARARSPYAVMLAMSAVWAARIQVAAVYFDAAVGKFAVPEWMDGTALYYWMGDPQFGAPHWLRPLLMPLLTHATVAVLTYAVLLLEVLLFLGLVMEKRFRGWLLIAGIGLHAGIWLVHGLPSFSLDMFAALILYLRPFERPFDLAGANPLRTIASWRVLSAASPIRG
jgi:antimicrobial peptide system SdpB family protein